MRLDGAGTRKPDDTGLINGAASQVHPGSDTLASGPVPGRTQPVRCLQSWGSVREAIT